MSEEKYPRVIKIQVPEYKPKHSDEEVKREAELLMKYWNRDAELWKRLYLESLLTQGVARYGDKFAIQASTTYPTVKVVEWGKDGTVVVVASNPSKAIGQGGWKVKNAKVVMKFLGYDVRRIKVQGGLKDEWKPGVHSEEALRKAVKNGLKPEMLLPLPEGTTAVTIEVM